MKAKAIITTFFLCTFIFSVAQELPKPRISIQFGMAVPFCQLADTDANSISSGFAEMGLNGAVEGMVFFNKDLAAGLRYGSNFLKSKNDLSSIPVDSNATLSVDKQYRIQNVMFGLYYMKPIGEKFSIYAKVMIGLVFATTPEYKLDYQYDDPSQNFQQNIRKGSTSGPGYLVGIGGSYYLGELIDLTLNVDYNYSKPEFDRTILGQRVKYKQSLAILGVNIGIAFKLK